MNADLAPADRVGASLPAVLAPLALAQFICSFAGSNMNVMITDISKSLNTNVHGVQTAITAFLLVMAALMIPGGKLTDRYGRTRLLRLGLVVYGAGALLSAAAQGLGMLIAGYSILEGIGTALLIPPVYILTTLLFTGTTARARAFGAIMAMGGLGAAAGPLIGGLITSGISWRAAFVFQALVVAVIVWLSRGLADPLPADPARPFDVVGTVLSAVGLILVVMGILAASSNGWLTLVLITAGAVVLAWFFLRARGKERRGKEPLLSLALFRNRTSNFGLVTQNVQWLMLMGSSFTVAAYLQVVRHYTAIQTGVIFTAATVGMLVSSFAQGWLAKRYPQRTLILAGYILAVAGVGLLLALTFLFSGAWPFTPGLLCFGLGIGAMLTPSVNVVQSSFGEEKQGEISGLSRCISNLGSSLGTAIAGTILVAGLSKGGYGAAMIALAVIGLGGLTAAVFLPGRPTQPARGPRSASLRWPALPPGMAAGSSAGAAFAAPAWPQDPPATPGLQPGRSVLIALPGQACGCGITLHRRLPGSRQAPRSGPGERPVAACGAGAGCGYGRAMRPGPAVPAAARGGRHDRADHGHQGRAPRCGPAGGRVARQDAAV
jgi:MFS family permease